MKTPVDLRQCRELMGVGPGATPEELKRAYHDLVKVWHPDRFPNDPGLQARAQEKLKRINEAYQALKGAGIEAPRQPSAPFRPGSGAVPERSFSSQNAADERFFRSFVWILLALFAVVVVSFTFYLQDRPLGDSRQGLETIV